MVSKNNRYLKDVLQADKTQHWSLRKLGIGVTSVLLGTTFYLGGNTVAHADQTTPAAPTDNGGQVTQANQAETGNTAVLRAQPQSAAQSQATNGTSAASTAASASTAPVTSAPTTATQSATPTSAVQSAANSSAAVNSSVANNSAASTSDATQPESTTTLNVNSGSVASQAPAVAQSLAANDQNKTQTVWADTSSFDVIQSNGQKVPANSNLAMNSMALLGIEGTFKVDGQYLKAGNKINIATVNFDSTSGKVPNLWNHGDILISYKGQVIGNLQLNSADVKHVIVVFNVTKNTNVVGTATISFKSTTQSLWFNYLTDKHTFKPLPYTLNVNITNPQNKVLSSYTSQYHKSNYQVWKNVANGYVSNNTAYYTGGLADFQWPTVTDNTVLNDLQNSMGKNGQTNVPDTFKFYYRITAGSQSNSKLIKDINDPNYRIKSINWASIYDLVYPINSDGKLVAEDKNGGIAGHSTGLSVNQLANNLSLQQIDNSKFTGMAYSKQNDGSYLVVFHVPKAILKLNDGDWQKIENSQTVVFDPKNTDAQTEAQLMQKNKDYYGGALQDMPIEVSPQMGVVYSNPNNADTMIVLHTLNAQGKELYSGGVSPVQPESHVQDQAGLNIQYINIDTGTPMSAMKTTYADPGTKQSIDVPDFKNFHLVSVDGDTVRPGNKYTITRTANDVFVNINDVKDGKTTIAFPGQQNQIGNVYVFYQGTDEQGEVQFLDADTKDAKGPNGYKLLETKQTNQGHYGENFSFPAGQDPETILNHYTNTAHYVYDASKQGPNAYSFNKTYTYTDNANNNQGNIYYIYLHHATTPLNHTVTRTIRYIKSDGSKMDGVSDQVQKVSFTGTHDLVTDKDNWDANTNNTFSAVTSPTIKGYTVSQQTVPEVTGITTTTPDDIETVVYTPVVNIKSLTVDYIDDVTGNTLQADHFSGNEGESSNYNTKNTIANYKNQGYQLVSDPTHGETLKYDGNTYQIHFTHTVVPVDPTHPQPDYNYGKENLLRKVSRTINYINADGKLFSTKSDSMNFVGTGNFDKVTHQLVSVDNNGKITGLGHLTWVPDKESLPAVASPAVDNQHVALITPADQADGTNVKGITFDYNSGNLMVDVYYAKDNTVAKNAKTVNVTQTVHFVNAAGQTVLPDNVQTITFNRTPDVTNTTTNKTTPGAWDKDSDTYQDVVVPTLNGYVTSTKLVKGQTITHDSKNSVIVVVYQPTGSLIPVDQHGNPIKGAPTPQYPTDPNDPTKVTPNEPIPNVPGYRPVEGQPTTVTPGNPTQNTEVRYTNQQVAVVNYIDIDTGTTLATSGLIYGDAGSAINYSTADKIAGFKAQGYHVIYDDFDKVPQKFDNDIYTQQKFTILLSKNNSQGSQGSNSQGSNSQGSNSQGSNSQGSNSQGSNSQGSNSQGSNSQGSNSQGSNSQGSNSQGSNSQGSNSQGSNSQGSNSQGSNSQGSNSQGSNSQGSNSQGSNSQGSNSQGSNSQGSNSQGSNSQGSNSQGSNSHGSNSQGSNSQGSNSQGSNSQGSNSQGSNSQGSNSQGSNSQGSNSQGSNSQGSNSQGSNSQGSNSQGSNSQGSNSQGSNFQGSNSQGSNSQGSNSQGSNSQDSQTPNQGEVTGTITYVDQDNGGQPVKTVNINGKPGTKLGYDPTTDTKTLEDQGYVIVKNNIPDDATFNSDPSKNNYTITVKHGTADYGPNTSHEAGTPINPNDPNGAKWPAKDTYTKTFTDTVHFVGPDGNKLAGDNVQTSTWTRTVKVDKVTGQVLNPDASWTPDVKNYKDVQVPVISGYYASQKVVAGQPTVQLNLETTVEYHRLGKIIPVGPNGEPIPGAPTTTYQNDPNDPTKAITSQLPDVPGYTPTVSHVTPTDPGADTYIPYTQNGNNGNNGTTGNGGQVNGNGGNTTTGNNITGNGGNYGMTNGGWTPTATSLGNSNNGLSGMANTQPGVLGTAAVSTGVAGNADSGTNETANTKLPQTGNEAQEAIALGGLSALATLGMVGAAKKRHE